MATLPQMIQEMFLAMERRRANNPFKMDVDRVLSSDRYTDRPFRQDYFPTGLCNTPWMPKQKLERTSTSKDINSSDYANFNEIVRLRKEIRLLEQTSVFDSSDYHHHHHHHHYNHHQDAEKFFIFDDIPSEILEMVDGLIERGEDMEEHFNEIDEVAFKPRIFQSNFSEKDLESDTDSGNGTMQTENGSLSSQTLQDILSEPVQKQEEKNIQDQKASIHPSVLCSNILHFPENSDEFTDLPHFPFLLPPPPEFCEENILPDNKGLYVKGINANKGALKNVLVKSPVVLDKIPGTFLSQSCIDLSQISPKRRVTFADELVSYVHKSFSNAAEEFVCHETKTQKTDKLKSTPKVESASWIKSKSFNVFKFLSKKQQYDREKETQAKNKFKKKFTKTSEGTSSWKIKNEINDDPFYPGDFDDFSSDDDSFEEDLKKETGKQDHNFLTAFTSKVKLTIKAANSTEVNSSQKVAMNQDFRKGKELKRGSVDGVIEMKSKSSKQERNSIPEFPTHSNFQKDKIQLNPLKKFKLRLKQFRSKGGDDNKSKKNKLELEDLNGNDEDIRKDVNEALMDSDEECNVFSESNKTSKDEMFEQLSSYYFPTPFSKKLSESNTILSPLQPVKAINFAESSDSRKINFETFLGSNGLNSEKSRTDDLTAINSNFKTGILSQLAENNSHYGREIDQNGSQYLTIHLVTSSNCSKGLPRDSFVDADETKYTMPHKTIQNFVSEETYVNYSDILLLNKNTSPRANFADHSTSLMNTKNTQQLKPPILKAKPCLKETMGRDRTDNSPLKINDVHPLFDDSTEKILKQYDSSRDLECRVAMNHCDKLSLHLRPLAKIKQKQHNSEIDDSSKSDDNLVTTSLQKLKSLCLRLVSDGKSMIIASTSSKSSFPERVADSIRSLADFSLESKEFGRLDKNESHFERLINQFVKVIDLFELTIDASEDLSRGSDETSLKLKSLLDLANDLAKALSTLLKVITTTITTASVPNQHYV